MNQTLYARVGGEKAITVLVGLFYKKVMLDTRVSHFFSAVDMTQLYQHQKDLFSMVMGGPQAYTGRDLGEAHRDLVENQGLNEEHFNIVAEHLLAALIELQIDPAARSEIMEIVAGTKDTILGQTTPEA